MITRRRFLSIAAGAGLAAMADSPLRAAASTSPLYRWQGMALGAKTSIVIAREDAPSLIEKARAEIARLERIFSLYRPDSAISKLNREGRLVAPPLELVELLSICDAIHDTTGGAFDPSVQPLWALYAERFSAGAKPEKSEIERTLKKTGWRHVFLSPEEVALTRAGMALTLNGIAQGYISDKVAALLRREGLSDVLVDMGEIVALGRQPDGRAWRVGIADPEKPSHVRQYRRLSDSAMATSAPLGTVFDRAATAGHILDPRSGYPGGRWRQVSVIAPEAASADALSTAFCLLTREEIAKASGGVEVALLR